MENNGLKPCPFCGEPATLENDGIRANRNTDGDLMTFWKVSCRNCGAALPSMPSVSRFAKDEQLYTVAQHDGRARAIEKWNRRHDDGKA